MGIFLNPGNSGFTDIRNGEYVDKSGLIAAVNATIETSVKLTCISRPRRFGKSFAAQMLCAYYDRSCDSSVLFQDLGIALDSSYQRHLNQYNVIYIDMTYVKPFTDEFRSVPSYLTRKITEEAAEAFPGLPVSEELPETLAHVVEKDRRKFIVIIDEWDAPIRENPSVERTYLEFLRTLFKSSLTTAKLFAAVYMTGILPIKKDGSQSAISDFEEYTMLGPVQFAEFVGFTEQEVSVLCETHQRDFDKMKQWYDGYSLEYIRSVYNPNSVMKAIRNNRFRSYWTQTSAADSLLKLISRDEKGLARTIAKLMGGIEVHIETNGFANDLVTLKNRDDVLTLLVHLGYLAYDETSGRVRIPNEEIRLEFTRAIREDKRPETMLRVQESEQLFYDTIHRNAEAVAAQIEKIHMQETSPIHANNEQTLRSVLQLAYFSYKDHYLKFEELPDGKGYADIVYLPKPGSLYPALLVELK